MGIEVYATELRKGMGLTTPPFRPQAAFDHLGVEYRECSLDGCLGMTLRLGGNVGVMVSSNIPEEGKRQFTAAHELGHVVIPSHAQTSSFKCTSGDLLGTTKNPLEIEANQFAAEWLMPYDIFKSRCAPLEPDFKIISELAYEYNVTLTAAATRFVETSDQEVMLITSVDGMMKYYKRSADFPYRIDLGKLPDTYARYSLKGKAFPEEFMAVASDEWFVGRQPESGEVLECSVKLGDYNTVLTMLWVE